MNDEDIKAVNIINESFRKQKAQKEQEQETKEAQRDAFKTLFNFIGGIINVIIMILLVNMHDRINLGITIFMITMATIVIIICMFNIATYSYSLGKHSYDEETTDDYSNVDISKAETSDSNPVIVSTKNHDATTDGKETKYYGIDDSMLIKNLSLLNDYE